MAEYETLGIGLDDGTILGRSATDKLGFYGKVPSTQPATIAAITTTQPTLGATAAYGFTTTAQFNALVAAVNQLIADQKTLGLRATA